MPDITSPRPVSGQPVATSWGTEVHDQLEGIQAGSLLIGIAAAAATGSNPVIFPRPYASPPIVVVGLSQPGALLTTRYYVVAANVTALGFTAYIVHADNTATTIGALTVTWHAIGTPA